MISFEFFKIILDIGRLSSDGRGGCDYSYYGDEVLECIVFDFYKENDGIKDVYVFYFIIINVCLGIIIDLGFLID